MGPVQRSRHEALQIRSERIRSKKRQFQGLPKVAISKRANLKQSSTKPLVSARDCKDHIVAVGFHLSAAMVGIGLGLLALWMMGYAVLSFSSR